MWKENCHFIIFSILLLKGIAASWPLEVGWRFLENSQEGCILETEKALKLFLTTFMMVSILEVTFYVWCVWFDVSSYSSILGLVDADCHATITCMTAYRSSEKFPADFLFWFLLHMTPRLWEDVLELHTSHWSWKPTSWKEEESEVTPGALQ